MTQPHLQAGEIVLREWHRQTGLSETVLPFSTLGELFALCLSVAAPEMLDRIVLRGVDREHAPHSGEREARSASPPQASLAHASRGVAFEFQSITITSQRNGE